jgi:outer membrane protein assembly factor BamB
VAEHPQSAPGHLLLADALANDGDRGDAIHHYREALRFADPQAQIEGRALVDVAKDRLFETLLAHADDPSFAALNSTKDVDALFDEAARQAPSADARWQACARRFDALERRQDSEKARTILRRTLDDEDLARELVELSPGYRRPMGDALSRRADSWLRSATDNDAAEFASAWAAGAAVDDWIRIARRFPLESTRPTFILRQAELLASRQQPLDAFRLLADFLASQPGADDEIKAYRLILSLAPSLGNQADLAFAERRLARRDGWSHRPTLRSSTALSDRLAWTTEPGRHAVIIPAGDTPRGLPASVLVAWEGTLRLCRSDTGASLWSSPANAAPESAVATMAGVLTPDANAITCRSWEDGKPLWQVKLLPQSPRDWQGLASTIGDGPRDGETTVSMTPVPATPLATRLGMVYAVTDDGWLTAIDLFQGKIRWQTHPVLAWGKRDPGDAGLAFTRLQILDGILIYQTTSRAFGVDSAGQLAWSIETLQGVADQNVVTVEDGVVLLVGRSEIACLAETTSEVRWRRKFSWPTWHAPQLLVDGDKLLALIDQYQLCRLDARTGTTLWECSAQTSPGASNRPPVVRAGQFLIESRHGLDCRSTEDGRLLWRLPTEPMLALATRGAGVESLVGGPSGLQWMCLDADTGKVRAQTPIPAIGDVVDVQWNDRTVLVRGESRTVGIDRTTTATPTRSSE